MDLRKKLINYGICTILGFTLIALPAMADNDRKHAKSGPNKAKNIIFMVPDGMGLSHVTAARIFANGPDGAPLNFEMLDNIGYQRTHSASSTVTDSAAAASAWAVGDKFVNGEISCHGGKNGACENQVPTILELAKKRGKATGLVVTSQISHATPAAFGSHAFSRDCGAEIARQFIEETHVDVILGGGIHKTAIDCDVYAESFSGALTGVREYIIKKAYANGYAVVLDEQELNAAAAYAPRNLLGLFEQAGKGQGKTLEMFRINGTPFPDGEPTLAEMTRAALNILEKDRDGLFLMVEGSQIDWEGHANRIEGLIAEILGFDEAVKVVLDWVNAGSIRSKHTLVVVAADHDCGGFAINGPYGSLSKAGDIVEPGWTCDHHTAVDTIIYSQGPGSQLLNAAVDNTDLYRVMARVLR